MKAKVSKTTGYADPLVNSLARDVQSGFGAIVDLTVHKVSTVWNPPMTLAVPFFGGAPRVTSPAIVRCERGRNLTTPATLVLPGGCSWEWAGDGRVRIDDVDGLTVGDKYDLVFSAVG
jgi:hypothetical protein